MKVIKHSESVCSVAHCSWSQDIDLFKFKLSYCYNPLQDTCPITSAVQDTYSGPMSHWFFSIGSRSPIGCLKNVQHCVCVHIDCHLGLLTNSWTGCCMYNHSMSSAKNCRKKLYFDSNFCVKFIPRGLIDNKLLLVQAKPWHWTSTEPSPEPMTAKLITLWLIWWYGAKVTLKKKKKKWHLSH